MRNRRIINLICLFFVVILHSETKNNHEKIIQIMTKKELRQQVACEWLEQNYLQFGYLRHDIVTDRLQIRVADLHSLEDAPEARCKV